MSVVEHALAELDSSRRRFHSELEGLNDADFVRPPTAGSWSASQVAEHIALSEKAMSVGYAATLAGRPGATSHPLDPLRKLLWTFQIYRLARVKTTQRLDPPAALPRAEALARLAAARESLLASLGTEPARLETIRLRHPVFGALTGVEMLRFASLHEERHRNQIVRIRTALARR